MQPKAVALSFRTGTSSSYLLSFSLFMIGTNSPNFLLAPCYCLWYRGIATGGLERPPTSSIFYSSLSQAKACLVGIIDQSCLPNVEWRPHSCCINLYAHATQLSAQIAEWHLHKNVCNTPVRSRV